LDSLSSLLDESLPLTVTDHLEFGNPITDEQAYRTIAGYSPYENLSNQEYPATMISMQLNDPRVPAFGTLKFVEKFRDLAKDPERAPHFGN